MAYMGLRAGRQSFPWGMIINIVYIRTYHQSTRRLGAENNSLGHFSHLQVYNPHEMLNWRSWAAKLIYRMRKCLPTCVM